MPIKTIDKYLKLIKERPSDFSKGKLEIITDKNAILKYEKENNCDLGLLYESPYHLLVKDLVKDGDNFFTYERVLKKNPSNAIVIIPKYKDKFVLLNQFRHSIRNYQLCFPRGFGEPNISVEENAYKELKEELGVKTLSYQLLGKVVADSGLCGEKVSICLCDITKPILKNNYEGINDIKIVNFRDFTSLINTEKIDDGYTLSAFSLYTISKIKIQNFF